MFGNGLQFLVDAVNFLIEFFFVRHSTGELGDRAKRRVEKQATFLFKRLKKTFNIFRGKECKNRIFGVECLDEDGSGCFSIDFSSCSSADREHALEGDLVGIPRGDSEQCVRVYNTNEREAGQVPTVYATLGRDEYVTFSSDELSEAFDRFFCGGVVAIVSNGADMREAAREFSFDALGSVAEVMEGKRSACGA